MQPLKSGYLSSEFVIALIAKIASVAVTLGVISQAQASDWQTNVANAAVGIASIIWMLGTAKTYIQNRTTLKTQDANLKASALQENKVQELKPNTGVTIPIIGALVALCFIGAAPAHAQQRQTQPVQRQANCFGLFNRQNTTDPAVLAMLGQLVNGQNQMLAMMAANQKSAPPAAAAKPMILLMQIPGPQQQQGGQIQQVPGYQTAPVTTGVPIQTFPLSQQPIQQFPLSQQPIQTFPLSQQPIQVLPLIQQPIQVLPVGAQPIQQLQPNTGQNPVQQLQPNTQQTAPPVVGPPAPVGTQQPVQQLTPTGTVPTITPNPGTIPNAPGARTPAVPTQQMPISQYRTATWRPATK